MAATRPKSSAAAPSRAGAEVPRLALSEVRYLALEGGGGKGFAYLGALEILEKQGVLANLRGVAGTSAGAITAMMIALGMKPAMIADELANNDFNTFFDPPLDAQGRRLIPAPFDYQVRDDNQEERETLAARDLKQSSAKLLHDLDNYSGGPLDWATRLLLDAAAVQRNDIGVRVFEALAILADMKNLVPVKVLLKSLNRYTAYFGRDMGFFSGKAAHDYFDMLIRREAVRRTSNTRYAKGASLTFQEHKLVFGIDLLMCGANLATGRSVLFSWKHTPNFPVADAVRISMGLPVIYKPYVLNYPLAGWPECGTYIDGGLWNNLPFREIGALGKQTAGGSANKPSSAAGAPPAAAAVARRVMADLVGDRNTLGLRLEITPPEPVLTGGALLGKIAMAGLAAGETQVIADLEPFTLILDTEGLDTLVFSPPDATKEKVNKRSRRAMRRYFDLPPEPKDADDADDRRIEELRNRSACSQ